MANINYSSSQPKLTFLGDMYMDNKDDLPSTAPVPHRAHRVLPPISSRRRSSSSTSFASNASTAFDGETTNRFTLPSKQNSFMKSISEIS